MKLEASVKTEFSLYSQLTKSRKEKDSGEISASVDSDLLKKDLPLLLSLGAAYYTSYLLSELYIAYSF